MSQKDNGLPNHFASFKLPSSFDLNQTFDQQKFSHLDLKSHKNLSENKTATADMLSNILEINKR